MDDAGHIISIDLETLGTTPGCAVLTAGIAVLRLGTGTVLHEEEVAIDLDDQLAAGLRVEASTLRWWMTQGEEARARAFPLATVRLREAAARIAAVMGVFARAPLCAGVYGWGADFDLPLLAALVRAGGVDGPLYSDHRLSRCGRTLCGIAGVKPLRSEQQHVALADALAQGAAIVEALRVVERLRTPPEPPATAATPTDARRAMRHADSTGVLKALERAVADPAAPAAA